MPESTYSARLLAAWFLTVFCLALAFTPLGPRPAAGAGLDSGREMFEERRRQVATLLEDGTLWVLALNRKEGSMGVGSAFVVAEGFALTNAHVTNDTDELWLGNARLPMIRARLVASEYDKSTQSGNDFALLSFEAPKNVSLPVMTFSLDVARTDRVSAWGFPYMVTQFDSSVQKLFRSGDMRNLKAPPVVYTEGTVSTIVRQKHACIIHTASIAGGNSGGPLVNRRGQVVGINTWGYHTDDEGAFLNASLTAANMLNFLTAQGIRPQVVQPDWDAAASREDSFLSIIGADKAPVKAPAKAPGSPDEGFLSIIASAASEGGSANGDWSLIDLMPSGAEAATDFDTDDRVREQEAQEIFWRAVAGDPDAMAYVGSMYLEGGEGFPADQRRAWHWLEAAADEDQPLALGLLGMLYLYGDDEDRDPDLAIEYLTAAAEAEEPDPDFQGFLAYVLYGCEAYGVSRDLEESLKWARQAAAAGNSTGKAVLGLHYYDGTALEQDLEQALRLAREAAEQGDSTGKALLALIYYTRAEHKAALGEIIRLCEEAGEHGEAIAQGVLACIYAFDDKKRDPAAAERWGRLAADQADPRGQYVLGWLYLNGQVVERNYPMAWAYLDFSGRRLEDLGADKSGPLLEKAEGLMTASDKRRGEEIQEAWLETWGLEEF